MGRNAKNHEQRRSHRNTTKLSTEKIRNCLSYRFQLRMMAAVKQQHRKRYLPKKQKVVEPKQQKQKIQVKLKTKQIFRKKKIDKKIPMPYTSISSLSQARRNKYRLAHPRLARYYFLGVDEKKKYFRTINKAYLQEIKTQKVGVDNVKAKPEKRGRGRPRKQKPIQIKQQKIQIKVQRKQKEQSERITFQDRIQVLIFNKNEPACHVNNIAKTKQKLKVRTKHKDFGPSAITYCPF